MSLVTLSFLGWYWWSTFRSGFAVHFGQVVVRREVAPSSFRWFLWRIVFVMALVVVSVMINVRLSVTLAMTTHRTRITFYALLLTLASTGPYFFWLGMTEGNLWRISAGILYPALALIVYSGVRWRNQK